METNLYATCPHLLSKLFPNHFKFLIWTTLRKQATDSEFYVAIISYFIPI